MPTRYYLSLPDPAKSRTHGDFAFTAQGADAFAEQLQDALRNGGVFERWRATQDDPEAVDPTLAATDPQAIVTGEQHDLHIDLIATTDLPGTILKHRLRLLAGNAWELRDVTSV